VPPTAVFSTAPHLLPPITLSKRPRGGATIALPILFGFQHRHKRKKTLIPPALPTEVNCALSDWPAVEDCDVRCGVPDLSPGFRALRGLDPLALRSS